MTYFVLIKHDGEQAILDCDSLEEAQKVYRSFIAYGKYQEVSIESTKGNENEINLT